MSDRPLAERLQVKQDRRLAVVNAPRAVDREIGVEDRRGPPGLVDVVLYFVEDRAQLAATLASALTGIREDAILWVAYIKQTSRRAGDVHRDVVRACAPTFGWTTVSQIAIDQEWSALRLKRLR